MEKSQKLIKIICPNCDRTDYYKVKPNYCAFCGKKINEPNNHGK